ncbi:hypothetical protein [Streptomyces sp. NPDC050738]|uniref:hypothetical protein n=1 Tax=Streptomyces sp. NPDC050738 TaxID=3154744 RepID=UPI00342859D3
MNHRPASVRRICPDCDGFPIVAITTGTRHADGSRHVLPVICQACHGTGRTMRPVRLSAPAVKVGALC